MDEQTEKDHNTENYWEFAEALKWWSENIAEREAEVAPVVPLDAKPAVFEGRVPPTRPTSPELYVAHFATATGCVG